MQSVKNVMTSNPSCCLPETSLHEVAKLMVECDCGEIPVVNNDRERTVVGVITDRDITCRSVGQGKNPLEMKARDCMTTPAITVDLNEDIDRCISLMEEHMIRRLPVLDGDGSICGMLSQADIARNSEDSKSGEIIKILSKPNGESSRVS